MGITPEDMLKINQQLEKAVEDTTPHVGVANDNILVIGDANKTENKKHDYKAWLRYPKTMAEHIPQESIVKVVGSYVIIEMEFKDVFITPRNDLKIVANIAKMFPFFRKLQNDGGITNMTDEELIEFASEVGDEILAAMYTVVGAILDIDDDTCAHLLYSSVLNLLVAFMGDFPEVFNETDFFSEVPIERAY